MKKLLLTVTACLFIAGNAMAAHINETIAEKTLINGLYYRLTHSAWPEMGIGDMYDATVLPKAEQDGNSDYVSGDVTIPATVPYNGQTYAVSTISDYAFYGCSNITSVAINSNLIFFGAYAFYGCSQLTDVTINSSNISFNGAYTFSSCGALKNVTFAKYNSVENFYVDDAAQAVFYNCANLRNIVLPSACEKVTDYFFGGCASLEYVNFGAVGTTESLLNTMGANVFYQCSGIKGIYISKSSASAPAIQSTTFSGIPATANVYVPCSHVSAYNGGNWSSVNVAGYVPYAVNVMNADVAKGVAKVNKEPSCDDPSAEIAAYPYAGYTFEAWFDEDTRVVYSYQAKVTIPNVNKEMNLTAHWAESDCSKNGTFPYQFNISSNNSNYGSVSVRKVPDCDDASAEIDAYPYAGYAFQAWYDADLEVVYSYEQHPTIANVNRNMNLVAYFEKSDCSQNGVFPYKLHIEADNSSHGSVAVLQAPDCDNASAKIGAYPYAGYAFEAWFNNNTNTVYSYESVVTIANVKQDMNLTAYFVPADCSSNGTFPYRLDVESADSQQGAVAIYKAPTCDNPSARISASGFAGYTFEAWLDANNGNTVYSYEAVTNIANVDNDMHLVAYFMEAGCEKNGVFPYMFDVLAADPDMGTIETKNPTCDDSSARAYARPNIGYEFVAWSDGTTANPRTWTDVSNNVHLSAMFKEKSHGCQIDGVLGFLFQIEPNDYNMGATMMTRVPDCVDPQTQIAAIAKEGYEFVRWSDGNKNAMRTITVTGDIYIQALFQDPEHPLQGIEQIIDKQPSETRIILLDGALYILRNDRIYTISGQKVK